MSPGCLGRITEPHQKEISIEMNILEKLQIVLKRFQQVRWAKSMLRKKGVTGEVAHVFAVWWTFRRPGQHKVGDFRQIYHDFWIAGGIDDDLSFDFCHGDADGGISRRKMRNQHLVENIKRGKLDNMFSTKIDSTDFLAGTNPDWEEFSEKSKRMAKTAEKMAALATNPDEKQRWESHARILASTSKSVKVWQNEGDER
jgi:hypothetical protein